MKKYISFIIHPILVVSIAIGGMTPTLFAVTYPVGTPVGEEVGGWFNTYFSNIFDPIGCNPGQVLRGFTNTGMLICITPTVVSCLPGGTGLGNSCYGSGSLQNGTNGANNTANGDHTLYSNTTGNANSAYGARSLYSNTNGSSNTANGYQSLYSNISGSSNIANGASSLFWNTTGSNNVANGFQALLSNITGSNNTANGYASLSVNTLGSNNTADGYQSLGANTTGCGNIAVGYQALGSNTIGNSSIANGYRAGFNLISGDNNVAIGANTDFQNPIGSNQLNIANVIFGVGLNGTVGSPAGNIGIGTASPGARLEVAGQIKIVDGSQGSGKVLVSDNAGLASWSSIAPGVTATGIIGSSGSQNYLSKFGTGGIGIYISQLFDDGSNVGIGTATPGAKLEVAGQVKITGGTPGIGKVLVSDAVGLATWSPPVAGLPCIPTGIGLNNTCYGSGSLQNNTNGGSNTANGIASLFTNTTGNQNTADGFESLFSNTSGYANTANGYRSSYSNTTGFQNTANGFGALYSNIIGNTNLANGYRAGFNLISGDNNMAIGSNTDLANPIGSNQLNIGNAIFGVGLNGTVGVPAGNIGIGTASPTARLEVAGQIKITGGLPGIGKVLSSDATGLATWVNPAAIAGAWLITGNSGTIAGTNFLGTTDAIDLVFKTNNIEQARILSSGNMGIGTPSPGSKLEVAGQVKITGGAPGLGKILTSDATGLATWTGVVTATGINITGSTLGSTLYYNGTKWMAGTGLYNTGGNIGIGAIPTTKLEVAGQVKITGGSPGLGKILTSDATGLATWTGVVTATGINITGSTLGSTLYYNGINWMAGTGLYNTGGNIGIGTTTPGAKLTLDSGTTGSGGLRFSRISSTSTPYAGAALGLGIDVAGNIVPISNGDVVVYTAQGGHPKTTVPDPDLPNRLISYDFNTYFAIPTKQSFVVSDGNGPGYNAPYFKENGTSGICSGGGSPYDCAVNDPVVGTSASPNNSFTMTAKGSVYGYQLALGARGDAPLFARSGKFVGAQTGGLYLSDNVTPTPWQKVLTVPANHLEYFYVNIGYNSQLQTIAGGGNVGIGTSFPDRRLVIASSGTTTADDPMVQIRRGFQGADAALGNVYGIPYLNIGGLENRVGSIQTIGFGYNSQSGTVRTAPAEIGFITTSVAGNTQGDIVFANRNGTANAAPTEVMRIKSTGNVGIGTANPQKRLEIDSGINDTSGLRFTRLNNTSPLTSSGIVTIGVNASGDVVGISPVSNIAVYEGVNRSMALSPDPDTANLLIKYNYNNYFAIPGKQSFVVSNGATVSDNGPFIKENGVVGVCSWNGLSGTSPYNCTDTVDGLSASPQNSFTMSAKSDNVGYQISLGARGDAPLMARSGYFTDSLHQTGGLYLADRTTISPWQKVISLPVNHPEYLFVNNGFNSQLQVISGGGNVAVGTTYPASRFEVWTGASTAPLLHFRGTRNVALGLDALDTSATGSITSSNNTAIGYNAGQNLTTGSNNILLGADTLAQANNSTNTLNIGNTIFGTNLPSSFGGVSGDIGLGVVSPSQQLDISRSMNLSSTRNSTTGVIYKNGTRFLHNFAKYAPNDNNVFIGLNAGNFTMGTGNLADPVFYGTENVGIGANALIANTTGYSNTAIGHTTLGSNTTGYNNMAVGWGALGINTTGYGNSGIGRLTLGSNTTGFYNSALGMSALQSNIVGYYNSAVGYSALSANTTGFHNTANGYQSLLNNTTGQYNTAIGNLSLRTNSVGVQNTAVGYAALNSTTASYNTAIGLLAGSNITSANYNIAIGYNAQVASPTYGNQLSIGNWIYGSGGSIGIGTSSPTAKLDINGTIRIAGGNPGVGKILMSDATGIASWQTPSGGAVIPWTVAGNSGTSVASNFVGTTDLVDLAFRTNNVENMRLTSGGNLGIGTTNPGAYKLNINGTTYHANNIDIAGNRFINFLNPGTGLSSGLQWNLGTDTASMYVSEVVADQTDYVFKLSDNATGDRFVWQIHDWSPFDVFPMTLAGNYGNFYSGAMYIDNSSYGSAGRVGFGTTSPNAAAKVDINGLISIRGGSPGNGKVLVSDATGLASWQALSGSSGALGNWSIVGNTGTVATTNFIGTIDAIDLLFKTTNIERLRLNASNGNLTIGGDMMLGRGAGYVFGNTTFGAQALNSNGAGYQNTAIGYRTLAVNTTGYSNTAIGYAAGSGVSTGISNTFVGYRAGANITTGSSNIAIGNDAQVGSATFGNQLSIGNWIYGSGGYIGIGTNNPTAKLEVNGTIKITGGTPGANKILTSDATGLASWGNVPASTTEWSKSGNTIAASDFIGTLNAQDLVFKTNNTERARILQNGNISINSLIVGRGGNGSQVSTTALGLSALLLNTTGVSNTAMGNSALASVITGGYNTAIGHGSLFATTGNNNTAIGYNAGTAITTGTNNIAIGYNAAVPSPTASNQLSIGNWIYGSGGYIGIGTTTPSNILTVSGSLRYIDGNQGVGKYLKSDANGVASWQSPTSGTGTFIYRMSASASSSSNVLLPVADLTSASLGVGPYQFELIGKFQSAAISNGIGITLANNSAVTNEFLGTVSTQLTASTMFESSFTTAGTAVLSTDVPAVATDYAILMKGTFNVTTTGSVVVQYRSELSGTQVRLQPGTVLIIKSLNPSLAAGGI